MLPLCYSLIWSKNLPTLFGCVDFFMAFPSKATTNQSIDTLSAVLHTIFENEPKSSLFTLLDFDNHFR